jgi:hypothetical protein
MAPLAETNKYLKSKSLEEIVRENASASSAFEGVPAKARDHSEAHPSKRSKTASSKKPASSA